MNKKALYSILSTIVAMIILSVSLVLAIGPRVSADSEITVYLFNKLDDFSIDDNHVCRGLSDSVMNDLVETYGGLYTKYGLIFDNSSFEIHIEIPEGVVELCSSSPFYAVRSFITSLKLPDSLKKIGDYSIVEVLITTIEIPANVEIVGNHAFNVCPDLNTIYCACSEEYANEHWDEYWDAGLADDVTVVWNYKARLTVTFDSGVDSQTVNNGETVTEPIAPTKDGYEFKGWLLNSEPYDFATPVTEDMTLTAKWEEVQTQPEPEIPTEENTEVNNQNNAGLIWGVAGTSAGILIIAGIVVGIVITKRRRK